MRSAIESRRDLRVCGEAANGTEVVEKARLLRPDVIINSAMCDFVGLQTTNEIHRELPETAVVLIGEDSSFASESWSESHEPARKQITERDLGEVSAAPQGTAEAKRREGGLDKTLADTFPCSDPLSSIPNPRLQSW